MQTDPEVEERVETYLLYTGGGHDPAAGIRGKPLCFPEPAIHLSTVPKLKQVCREKKIPLYLIDEGNHSLETGDIIGDIEKLRQIMKKL